MWFWWYLNANCVTEKYLVRGKNRSRSNINPLMPSVAIWVQLWSILCQTGLSNFWHPGTLTLSHEHRSARMSKIANNGLTRSGTGCFIAVPKWQHWASKGWTPSRRLSTKWYKRRPCACDMQQRLSKNTPTKNFGALPLAENFDNNRQFSAIVKSDIRSRPASDAEKNSTAERRFLTVRKQTILKKNKITNITTIAHFRWWNVFHEMRIELAGDLFRCKSVQSSRKCAKYHFYTFSHHLTSGNCEWCMVLAFNWFFIHHRHT